MKKFSKSMVLIFLTSALFMILPLLAMIGIQPDRVTGNKTYDNIIMIAFILLPMTLIFFIVFKSFMKPFFSFIGGGPKIKKILRTGRPAAAVILAIGENSEGGVVTVNNQPYLNLQLEVRDGTKRPYVVSIDTIISRSAIPQFQPGAVIPIKISQDDPNQIAIDWNASSVPAVEKEKPTFGAEWSVTDQNLLKREGIDGSAKILSILDTGKSKNFNPVVQIEYEVKAKNIEPYTFTRELTFPTNVVLLLKKVIGKTYPARIHPQDRTKVKVDITF